MLGVVIPKACLWGREETEILGLVLFSHYVSWWLQGGSNNYYDDLLVSCLLKSKSLGGEPLHISHCFVSRRSSDEQAPI